MGVVDIQWTRERAEEVKIRLQASPRNPPPEASEVNLRIARFGTPLTRQCVKPLRKSGRVTVG